MWFKFAKLFFIVNTSVQAPTSLIASNDPNIVNYDITKDMVKHIEYNNFNDWATIPWNSAYFDVDQPDLKLVSGEIIGGFNNLLSVELQSDVAGVEHVTILSGTGVYDFKKRELDWISRIMFNHNFVSSDKKNLFQVKNGRGSNFGLQFELNFEIDKPLSFYIQGFMFYFNWLNFDTFTGNFTFSFLDYVGDTKYAFKGAIDNTTFSQDLYNFVTMPIRVPNLRHLTVFFDIHGTNTHSVRPSVNFGQINIFSSKDIVPVPPNSPFNPDYERVSWYDVFGHFRNAFRWVLYGVVGKILPVEPLREFFAKLDGLLRRIFDDTISSVLNVDFTSGLEQVLTLWVFLKAVGFLVGYEFIMPWYGYVLLGVILLIILYPFLITRKNIKILQRVGSYIISAPPRTGKSALACCLAQRHKGRVVSPIPIKVRNEYSYRCSYDDVFKFNQLNSNYAFKENDMLVLDELGLKINSNDLSPEFKETQESLGMFCKLIGHNFNGIMYMIEQHPDRIPKQAREKVEYIVQVKRMRIMLFLVKFKLNIYTNVDDYNKVVFSKRQTKKIIKRSGLPPSYSGETMTFSLWFPRSYLQRYNSRALNYIHSLKSELSTVKDYEQSQGLEFTVDDIRTVGLDKLDNILQDDKKDVVRVRGKRSYDKNKKFAKK